MTSLSVSWGAYDQLGHPSPSEDRCVCGVEGRRDGA
jgi:hypothetical protein